jgi:hypothetical protein
MTLGARLYRISKRRQVLAISLAVATVACLFTLYRPSLTPPGLHARGLQIGVASTQLLVAQKDLAVGGSADYVPLVNRAILVGNVMVSGPLLADDARALHVSPSGIQGTAPMTANVPRTLIEPGSGGSAADIIASPDRYRLEIQADPSVPILHLYAQGPSKAKALRLATIAVQSVMTYLAGLQASGKVPLARQVQVQQLGPVVGGVANPGASAQIAILVFVGVFGVALWLTTITVRIGRGWTAARLAEQLQS